MKITKLNIKSFRKIKDVSFDLQKINCFKGSNEVGKSTCLEAIYLLLTGETIAYGKQIYDNLNVENKDEAIQIEMVIETDKKTFDENGDLKPVLMTFGVKIKSTTQWSINSVKKNSKDYFNELYELFNIDNNIENKIKDINLSKLLIDPYEVDKLENKTLTKLLNYLVEIPTDEEIIMQNEQFKPVAMKLSENNFDADVTKKAIETEKVKQKTLIEQLEKNKEYQELKLHELNFDDCEYDKSKKAMQEQDAKAMELMTQLEKSKEEDLKNDIARNEKYELLFKQLEDMNIQVASLENRGIKIKNEIADLDFKLKNNEQKIKSSQNQILTIKEAIKNNANQIQSLKSISFEIECPECHHKFINDNKAVEKINANISSLEKDSEAKKQQGIKLKSDIEKMQKENVEFNSSIENKKVEFSKLSDNFNEKVNEKNSISNQINELKNQDISSEKTKQLTLDLENAKIECLNKYNNYSNLDNIYNKINDINKEIEKIENEISEKNLQLSKLDLFTSLVGEYKTLKNKIVDESLFKAFGDLEISLFEEGKAKSSCNINLNGVKFNGVNTANKLILGIKVIEKLRQNCGGKDLPILFDIIDMVDETRLDEILSKTLNNQIAFTYVEFEKEKPLTLIATNDSKELIKNIKGE